MPVESNSPIPGNYVHKNTEYEIHLQMFFNTVKTKFLGVAKGGFLNRTWKKEMAFMYSFFHVNGLIKRASLMSSISSNTNGYWMQWDAMMLYLDRSYF